MYVRGWLEIIDDVDWDVCIIKVLMLSPYILMSILNIVLFRLSLKNGPSLCMRKRLITPFLLLRTFVAG